MTETVYEQKKEYVRANEYISKVISMLKSDELDKVYRHKGEIMLELDQLDSARYYFALNKDVQDVYGRAARYDGLYELEKRLGNWEAAVQNADAYMVLYDSIQELSDRQKLDELMDNHQLEEHKRMVSRQEQEIGRASCRERTSRDWLFGRYCFYSCASRCFLFHVE